MQDIGIVDTEDACIPPRKVVHVCTEKRYKAGLDGKVGHGIAPSHIDQNNHCSIKVGAVE